MSWVQQLDVSSGEARLNPGEQSDTYTVEGVLRCKEPAIESAEQFLVGFRKVDHSIQLAGERQTRSFEVHGVHIQLMRRHPYLQRQSPQPTNFLSLCQRLLRPLRQEGDEWYGYEFWAHLNLVDLQAETFTVTDAGHPDSAVEFAHIVQPYVLVRHRGQDSFPSAEDLMGEFENRWWPLSVE